MQATTKRKHSVVEIVTYGSRTMEHVLASGLGERKANNLAARMRRDSAGTIVVRPE